MQGTPCRAHLGGLGAHCEGFSKAFCLCTVPAMWCHPHDCLLAHLHVSCCGRPHRVAQLSIHFHIVGEHKQTEGASAVCAESMGSMSQATPNMARLETTCGQCSHVTCYYLETPQELLGRLSQPPSPCELSSPHLTAILSASQLRRTIRLALTPSLTPAGPP